MYHNYKIHLANHKQGIFRGKKMKFKTLNHWLNEIALVAMEMKEKNN